jgi:hypothetical protein
MLGNRKRTGSRSKWLLVKGDIESAVRSDYELTCTMALFFSNRGLYLTSHKQS